VLKFRARRPASEPVYKVLASAGPPTPRTTSGLRPRLAAGRRGVRRRGVRRSSGSWPRAQGPGVPAFASAPAHITIVVESVVAATPGSRGQGPYQPRARSGQGGTGQGGTGRGGGRQTTRREARADDGHQGQARRTKAAKAAAEPVDTTETSETASDAKAREEGC